MDIEHDNQDGNDGNRLGRRLGKMAARRASRHIAAKVALIALPLIIVAIIGIAIAGVFSSKSSNNTSSNEVSKYPTTEVIDSSCSVSNTSSSSSNRSGTATSSSSNTSDSSSNSSSSSSSSTTDTGGATGNKITMDQVLACTDKQQYFELIMPEYNKYGKMFNIPFPGILAAQTCFEVGAPNNISESNKAANNLGGLGNGTWDGIPGAHAPSQGHFAAFDTVSDYIYAACYTVAKSGYYDDAMNETSDYKQFWKKLISVWCADPSDEYYNAVLDWYEQYSLGSMTTSSSSVSNITCKNNSTSSSNTSNSSDSSGSGQAYDDADDAQKKIVAACKTTPSPGDGYCAMWVSNVYTNAGLPCPSGNACDMYDQYCTSNDLSQLKVGMIISVRTHDLTYAGSIYGHVGIYIGDGQVMDNVGEIRTTSVDKWIHTWDGHITSGDGVRWGFGPGVS